MENKPSGTEDIKQQKMLPMFYHSDAGTCLEVAHALYAAGIRVIEFTNRGKQALDHFKRIAVDRTVNMKGLILAAGTIRTPAEAFAFAAAGADILISPVMDKAVAQAAAERNTLWIPGCMTPTEIHQAEQAGCKMVKIFPAQAVGPSFLQSIKDIFPRMDLLVTGGVTTEKENLMNWFSAGACAVGIGTRLIPSRIMEEKNYPAVTTATRNVMETIASLNIN